MLSFTFMCRQHTLHNITKSPHPRLRKKLGQSVRDLEISVRMQKRITCKQALCYKSKQKESQCNCQDRCHRDRFRAGI